MIRLSNANTEKLALAELAEKKIEACVLRLDNIHPVISGNKWFKLKYHLEDAAKTGKKTLLTFGGAWSNHIIATACAARSAGWQSIGIIRSEEPEHLSSTLEAARAYGMQLKFVPRHIYQLKDQPGYQQALLAEYPDAYLVPEGGAGAAGVRGAAEILSLVQDFLPTHIMCAIGTGTMFTGIANAAGTGQQVIGIPVLKGMKDLEQAYSLLPSDNKKENLRFFYDYHFGGYAKKTPGLLQFMNAFFHQTGIPTDIVYTSKLLYAFTDLLKNDYFAPGSRVLIIHSGGLQGNHSLPAGTLSF